MFQARNVYCLWVSMCWECNCSYLSASGSGSVLRLHKDVWQGCSIIWYLARGWIHFHSTPVGGAGFGSLQPVGLRSYFPAGFVQSHPHFLVSWAFLEQLSLWHCQNEQSERDSGQDRNPPLCKITSKCTPSSSAAFSLLEVATRSSLHSRGGAGGLTQGCEQQKAGSLQSSRNCPPHCLCSILTWLFVVYFSLYSSFALCKPASIFILGETQIKDGPVDNSNNSESCHWRAPSTLITMTLFLMCEASLHIPSSWFDISSFFLQVHRRLCFKTHFSHLASHSSKF